MKAEKHYWPIVQETLEVLEPLRADHRGGMYHIPKDALELKPIEAKQGFAVVAKLNENRQAIGSDYIEDNRGTEIFNKVDMTQYKTVIDLGEIQIGWTTLKPTTQFDEWIGDSWVTNLSNKYIAEFDAVDSTRRGLYVQTVDPFISEANIKRLQGFEVEASSLEQQALAARLKIQTENPWPIPPTK